MGSDSAERAATWRTSHGDLTDEEWAYIADLTGPARRPGDMGRPRTVDRRRIVDAIFYVVATGCQWRALPKEYPNWNTVHRKHLQWSRDGTWERIAERLAELVRQKEGREAEPSAGIVDARSVRGTSNVTGPTRGYDAGKKISGRKTFGIVDTLGLLMAVVVVAASVSDNVGGIAVLDRARTRSSRFKKLWCDAGFKKTFLAHARGHHVAAEVVASIHEGRFEVLPRRWVVDSGVHPLSEGRAYRGEFRRATPPQVTTVPRFQG